MPREANHSRNYGGKRAGAGRPMGSRTKYQQIYEYKAIDAGEHPVDFMLNIMHDKQNDMKTRMHACHAVLPYVAARLNAIDINVSTDLDTMTLAEKLDRVTSLRTGILEQQPDILLPALEGEVIKVNGSE